MFESVLRWWCRIFHRDVFHPVRGKYICGQCLREWPVPWTNPQVAEGQPLVNTDVIVTAPEQGKLLIRLPIRHFRSVDNGMTQAAGR